MKCQKDLSTCSQLLTVPRTYTTFTNKVLYFFNHFKFDSNMRVQTEAIHFSADVRLLDSIEKKMSKLENFFDRIIEARVILKLENSGQIRDKIAEIKIHLPNGIIFIKEVSKTFEAALDKALVALKRQLVKYKEKVTGRRYVERTNREKDTI